jgi:hypothetical protein
LLEHHVQAFSESLDAEAEDEKMDQYRFFLQTSKFEISVIVDCTVVSRLDIQDDIQDDAALDTNKVATEFGSHEQSLEQLSEFQKARYNNFLMMSTVKRIQHAWRECAEYRRKARGAAQLAQSIATLAAHAALASGTAATLNADKAKHAQEEQKIAAAITQQLKAVAHEEAVGGAEPAWKLQTTWAVGDTVEAFSNGSTGGWYESTVAAVNEDGSYEIDGHQKTGIPLTQQGSVMDLLDKYGIKGQDESTDASLAMLEEEHGFEYVSDLLLFHIPDGKLTKSDKTDVLLDQVGLKLTYKKKLKKLIDAAQGAVDMTQSTIRLRESLSKHQIHEPPATVVDATTDLRLLLQLWKLEQYLDLIRVEISAPAVAGGASTSAVKWLVHHQLEQYASQFDDLGGCETAGDLCAFAQDEDELAEIEWQGGDQTRFLSAIIELDGLPQTGAAPGATISVQVPVRTPAPTPPAVASVLVGLQQTDSGKGSGTVEEAAKSDPLQPAYSPHQTTQQVAGESSEWVNIASPTQDAQAPPPPAPPMPLAPQQEAAEEEAAKRLPIAPRPTPAGQISAVSMQAVGAALLAADKQRSVVDKTKE